MTDRKGRGLDPMKLRPADTKDVDLRYGISRWKPQCLQCLNSACFFLLFMVMSNIFSDMIGGLLSSSLSTLERRFLLSSSQSSWINSAYQLGTIPAYIIVVFRGHRMHRPRWSAAGALLIGFAALFFVVPHFTTGAYQPGTGIVDHGLCLTENITTRGCTADQQISSNPDNMISRYLILFITLYFIAGFGAVPSQTIGFTFLDDVCSKPNFAFFLSIYYASGLMGPAIGYIAGGSQLKLFTDFHLVNNSGLGITHADPRWVGAWWLGFLIAGLIQVIFSLPLLLYANDLPGAADIRAAKVSETFAGGDHNEHMVVGSHTGQEIWRMFKKLMTNYTYIFVTLAILSDAFIATGLATFGPKLLQSKFNLTSSYAGVLFGVLVVPSGVCGTILGGYVVKRLELTIPGILKLQVALTLVLLAVFASFLITCKPATFAGINVNYHSHPLGKLSLSSPCNSGCGCEGVAYNPVCGSDNIQYFSSCHAGCKMAAQDEVLHNCSCVWVSGNTSQTAVPKKCSLETCRMLPVFLTLLFVGMFIIFFYSSMYITVIIRCVETKARALALGLQALLNRALGTFLGPIAFGAAFDLACEKWQQTCSGRGACHFYEHKRLSLYIFLFCIGIKSIGLLFLLCAWKLYKPPKLIITNYVVDDDRAANSFHKNGYIPSSFEGDTKEKKICSEPIIITKL